ncbi:MAG: response regulator transcription factor [Gemmatimonas sp.]
MLQTQPDLAKPNVVSRAQSTHDHRLPEAAAVTRVLVIQSAATPPSGVAALLAVSSGEAGDFYCVTRAVDVLRAIGESPSLEVARRAAVAAAVGYDVVVVSLHEELVRLNERELALGLETLADVGIPVLVLTDFGGEADDDFIAAAQWLRRHVRGVLSIDLTAIELASALHAVRAGHVVVERRVSQALLQLGARKRPRPAEKSARVPGDSPPLSTREREVLALLAEGLATKNIAHELGISAHTVKAHVESIFAKFGATTRAEAVAIGVKRGAVML